MIANLQPYPEYKDSGVPWLGKIPARWDVRRMKLLLREVDSRSSTGKEQLLRVSQYTGVTQRRAIDGSDAPDTRASSLVGYKRVTPDDLVINIMLAWNGSLGVSRYEGIASPAYCVYRFKGSARPWYYHELLRLPIYKGRIKSASTGVVESRLRLYSDDLGRIEAIQPPAEEQDAIVRFIDYANGRLERAIRAKRKVIALLNEQKQAIIYRAVTRGLDPTVHLKPSGIPWLGDIPKHWQTPLFGRLLTRVEQGWSPVAAEGELASDQWAVLTLSSVRRGLFNPSAIKPVSRVADIPTNIQVADGDLLLTRSNTRDRVGDVCIAQGVRPKTLLCDLIYRLRLREGAIVPQFLVYQLLSSVGRGHIERDARGSSGTMPKISQGHIKSWRILLSPKDEQERIVGRIETEISPVNTAINRLEREIELLREYRTRLVSDVVTGKLDVRTAARQLPAEPVASEPAPDIEELTELEEAES
jgi:type I restriction enzyme S subunit